VQGGFDLVLYQGARDTAHARSLVKGSISSTFPLQDEGRWLLSQPSVLRSLNKRGPPHTSAGDSSTLDYACRQYRLKCCAAPTLPPGAAVFHWLEKQPAICICPRCARLTNIASIETRRAYPLRLCSRQQCRTALRCHMSHKVAHVPAPSRLGSALPHVGGAVYMDYNGTTPIFPEV